MLNLLDLFSGIGGFSLGLERTGGFRTRAFCEIDPFCRRVLAKHWPKVPCYDDVRTLTGERFKADGVSVDVICGGFPCQAVSLAGKRAGVSGSRSGLYREMLRAIRLVRPKFAVMENVAALLGFGMGTVLGDVAEDGLDAEWDCISASDVGAPHGRDRVWIAIADPDQLVRAHGRGAGAGWWFWGKSEAEATGDAHSKRELEPPRLLGNVRRWVDDATRQRAWWADHWQTKFEAVRRMDDGLPTRLDRSAIASAVARLGNAVVPQIPELIGNAILASLKQAEAA